MDKEPSIEDHVVFRKLLESKDPAALEVHSTFTTSKDHVAFTAGLLRVVRGGANKDVRNSNPVAKKEPATSKPPAEPRQPAVCRHFCKLGKCKSGSSCKFLHDSAQVAAQPVDPPSTPPRIVKIPLSKNNINDNNKQPGAAGDMTTVQSIDIETPKSPEDKAAATSRFLGLFGVRKGVHTTPNRVDHSLAPEIANPQAPTALSAPPSLPAGFPQTLPQSPPLKALGSGADRSLEDLLLDSPSTKKFWDDLEVKPTASAGAATWAPGNVDLGLDLSVCLGLGESKPPGFLPPPGQSGPPGFGSAPFFNGNQQSPLHHFQQPSQQPLQMQGSRLFPAGPGGPPPQMLQGPPNLPPGVYPPMPRMMYPTGMQPPHFQQGQFLPGMQQQAAPPPYPMSGMPGMPLHAQLAFGPPPPMHQNSAPAYMQVPQRPSNSHLSVHEMLGQSAPLSPGAEERSRQLMQLLGSGSSPARPAAIAQDRNPSAAPAALEPDSPASSNGGASSSPFSASLSGPASSAVGGQQQKSRALLSLLKSSKVGPTLSLSGNTNTNTSSPANTPRSSLPVPPALTKAPAPAPAPTPAAYSTPVKSKPKTSENGGPEVPNTPGVTATPAKKASFFRNTRFQTGTMVIIVNNTSRPHHVLRPSMNMVVQWQLPQAEFHTLMNNRDTDLVIGLVRYGSYTNSPCFVAKPVESRPKLFRDNDGNAFYQGNIVFHAPKSAGQFVYRLFDQATKESVLTTLATSPVFSVELTDFHVNTNLKHILEALAEKSKVKGISQLPAVLRGIRNGGKEDRSNGSAELMLNDCMTAVLRAIDDAIPVIDAWRDNRRKAAADESNGNNNNKEAGDTATAKEIEDMRANYKQAMRVHSEAHEAIVALLESRIPWSMLPDPLRDAICAKQTFFCPHLQRYASNPRHLQQIRFEEYGFTAAVDSQRAFTIAENTDNASYAHAWARLNASIDQLMPKLLPRADFQRVRETAVAQLQLALLTEHAVPPGTEVALYGSSNNSFGSDGADMDMTLLFPPSVHLNPDDKPMVIERLAAVLTRIGMSNVAHRATARIPIVQFSDPLNTLECDISLQNNLAVANTKLLRTYGAIDPRVRILVFLIKHWAKSRHLNSPSDGTLSSYGFILCLLHFLQNRPVPLVPNLQTLPPTWSGQRRDPSGSLDLSSALGGGAGAGPQHGHNRPPTSREQDEARQFERQSLPSVLINSADCVPCNAYFYSPTLAQPQLLSAFAQGNRESVGELLVEFFHYFCWKFDSRHCVVSVRQAKGLSKLDKAEHDAWLQSDTLSIEDPFETHYDVAHVIKSAQMAYFRKELLRAYTLASRVFAPTSSNTGDALPAVVEPEHFVSLLCEACAPPAFTTFAKEKLAAAEATQDNVVA